MRMIFILVFLVAGWAAAQDGPPEPVEIPDKPRPVDEAPAAPVIIHGKPVEKMTDDELQQVLQEKVIDIDQEDGEVRIIKIAPGYPVTLRFSEPITHVVVGDTKMIGAKKVGRMLVVNAMIREEGADTSLQVFFGGNKVRVYQVMIVPNLAEGLTSLRVNSFSSEKAEPFGTRGNGGAADVKSVSNVIANYDTLLAERSISANDVKRVEVFKKNEVTGFTVYYIYRFRGGPLAISFSYRNPLKKTIRFDESQLRLQLGNVRYIPDFVHLHQTVLNEGESTTGFAVVGKPSFSIDQPLDLIWR